MAVMEVDGVAADPNSGTGGGMLAFLDYVIRKNEMVEATAAALRTGCKKVLEVEDNWQNLDLRNLDTDQMLVRFRNKYRAELRERSLYNYEQRFRQTVEMYFKWLDNDPSWRPAVRASRSANGAKKAAAMPVAASPSEGGSALPVEVPAPTVAASAPGVSMVAYPLPIRPGVQGRLVLPEDLTKREAQRIGAFVSALAFDERLAITSGTSTEDED
jgi:hypothetical protein